MKKKNSSSIFDELRHKFPPTPLYRSDLEDIISVAQSRELAILISDDQYEYESLDDLKENKGSRIKNLTITLTPDDSRLRTLTIKFNSDGVILASPKMDKLVYAWHEIKEIIERQVPWYSRFIRPLTWAYGAIFILFISPKKDQIREGMEWVTTACVAGGSVMLFLSLISFVYLKQNRGVHLQREHEVQRFWDRYGEKLILLIAGTVLGVVGKFVSDSLSGQ